MPLSVLPEPTASSWASRWADQTVALLAAMRRVDETGELPDDPVVAATFRDGSFEDIVAGHCRDALSQTSTDYNMAVRRAMDQFLAKKDLDSTTRLGELLHVEATSGWWLQRVPLGQSTCGALEGESLLFGLGVFMTRNHQHQAPCINNPAHLEHLHALLLADYQISNAFRVVLLPVLLGTAQTAALDAWKVAQLRGWLESWAESNVCGHPCLQETQSFLKTLGVQDSAARPTDLDGRPTRSETAPSVMDAYTLVGLVLHSPQDPVSDEPLLGEGGALSTLLFPRSQCAGVLSSLEDEQRHIDDTLSTGLLNDVDDEQMRSSLVRCEKGLRELRAVYGACLLPPQHPQAARPNGANTLVHQALFDSLGRDQVVFLVVVASASPYYDSLKPTQEALRYLRLRAGLNHAGRRVGLETSAGLTAEAFLDDERHQTVLHLYHPKSGLFAGSSPWQLMAWESPEDYLAGLNAALVEAGVVRTPPPAGALSGLH